MIGTRSPYPPRPFVTLSVLRAESLNQLIKTGVWPK